MTKRFADKDPDEILDYSIDWSAPLAGDIIASSTWTLPTGIAGSTESHTDDTTTIRLSGGSDGVDYSIPNRIQTLVGRRFNRTWKLRVRTK